MWSACWGNLVSCAVSILVSVLRKVPWGARDIFVDNGDTLPVTFNVNHWEIVEGDLISNRGTWGPVRKARWLDREVAIKTFDARSTSLSKLLMSREAIRLLRLRHTNIVYLIGFYFLAKKDWILASTMIMELMDCHLDEYFESRCGVVKGIQLAGLPFWDEGIYIIAQIANGMNHVHRMGICHRGLKPQNILIRKSDTGFFPEVKIADFGFSEIMRPGRGTTPCNRDAGTLQYKAPEQFGDRSNTTLNNLLPAKMDVFSFAVLCSKLLTGVEPYSDQEIETTLRNHIASGNTPTIPEGLPKKFSALLRKCLSENPTERPGFQEICDTLRPLVNKIWKRNRRLPPSDHKIIAAGSNIFNGEDGDSGQIIHQSSTSTDHSIESVLAARGFPPHLKDSFIDESEITECGKIGQETDAVVYKVELRGCQYAGRCVPVRLLLDKKKSTKLERAEMARAVEFEGAQAARLPNLTHENLVAFFGYSLRKNETMFVMELMQTDLGQLTLMRSRRGSRKGKHFRKPFDNQTSRNIMTQIAAAMEFLHTQNLWHGDLHCSNILVLHKPERPRCLQGCSKRLCFPPFKGHSRCLKGMVVKLTDYGSDPCRCATDYAAPEMLTMKETGQFAKAGWKRKSEEEKSQLYRQWDVYSFGALCHQLLSGEFPLDTVVRQTCRQRKTTICKGERPDLPADTDEVLKNLIGRCWHHDPALRPGFSEIHRILSGDNLV